MTNTDTRPDRDETPLQQALELLRSALEDSGVSEVFPEEQLPTELRDAEELRELFGKLIILRRFILSLANGDLSQTLSLKGYTAGILKMLQSSLNHLSMQAQSIAGGDFSKRVDFMDDFSEAFNSMAERLGATLSNLEDKEQALLNANAELHREMEQRRRVEEELRKSQDSYRTLTITDPLTGLPNRRHFFTLALDEMQRACRFGNEMSIVMLDLDHFKRVNDAWGHAVGDLTLQGIAAKGKEALRTVDIIARWGGEEFALLLPQTGLEGAMILAERLRASIEESPLHIGTETVQVTVSLGVCAFAPLMGSQGGPENLEHLLNLADRGLYQAKNEGRNRVVACEIE